MSDFLKLIENNNNNNFSEKNRLPKSVLVVLCVTGGTATAISLLSLPFITPAFRRVCLPFVPASKTQLVNVLIALRKCSGNLVDVGSGDGRIVHAAASLGLHAVGVELNYFLILYSRFQSYWKGVWKNTRFYRKDIWSFNLKPFSNVVIFGTDQMMPKIEKKCLKELENGSIIITCRFPLPNMRPLQIIGTGLDTVWKYRLIKDKLC